MQPTKMAAASIVFNILLILFAFTNVKSMASTNDSRDFIFGFINNCEGENIQLFVIVSNANDETTNVTISGLYHGFQPINYSIPPRTVQTIEIEPRETQAQFGDVNGSPTLKVEPKGLRIQSSLPVTVYAYSNYYFTSDTFTILPIEQLGMKYVAVGTVDRIEYPNAIIAVAYEDNTTISIGNQTATLNALHVATLAIKDITSGITITGDKPFAAFSGNECGYIETSILYGYAMTTLLPTDVWGIQYPLVPFMSVDSIKQRYQIVANSNGTVLHVSDGSQYHMEANEYLLISITDNAAMLTSNFPVQLIQMGQNTPLIPPGYTINDTARYGGPFFLQIPSIDKWTNHSVLYKPGGFVMVVCCWYFAPLMHILRIYTTAYGVGKILFDNVPIDVTEYRRIIHSDYFYYENQTSNQTHRISVAHPNVTYSAVSYAYGANGACGFPIPYSILDNEDTMTSTSTISSASETITSTKSETTTTTTIKLTTTTTKPTSTITTSTTTQTITPSTTTTTTRSTTSITTITTTTNTVSPATTPIITTSVIDTTFTITSESMTSNDWSTSISEIDQHTSTPSSSSPPIGQQQHTSSATIEIASLVFILRLITY